MDRQVSKVNKSDARDYWWQCHEEGKEAYDSGREYDECPYEGVASQEWKSGWMERWSSIFLTAKEIFYGDE